MVLFSFPRCLIVSLARCVMFFSTLYDTYISLQGGLPARRRPSEDRPALRQRSTPRLQARARVAMEVSLLVLAVHVQ